MQRTLFVTRHSGAREWAHRRGFNQAEVVDHLSAEMISLLEATDTVIGSLPVHIAAAITAAGARYLHLALDLPVQARNRDLTADEMDAFAARLEQYLVYRAPSTP